MPRTRFDVVATALPRRAWEWFRCCTDPRNIQGYVCPSGVEMLQGFVEQFTYLGLFAVLLLGSLGVPIPEEMPIVAAAILSHEGIVAWALALPLCLLGVLSGDVVLYWVGRRWGESVLNWRAVRWIVTPERERRLQAAYRRHAFKTIIAARHVTGLRTAAFLTAGNAHVPFWKFVVADAGAAVLGVPLLFGLAYFFTDQIKAVVADVHRVERWFGLAGFLALAAVLAVVVWRWNRRVGTTGTPGSPPPADAARPWRDPATGVPASGAHPKGGCRGQAPERGRGRPDRII
jgi:membrane protein DedA with SNARE-associated domain